MPRNAVRPRRFTSDLATEILIVVRCGYPHDSVVEAQAFDQTDKRFPARHHDKMVGELQHVGVWPVTTPRQQLKTFPAQQLQQLLAREDLTDGNAEMLPTAPEQSMPEAVVVAG